MTCLIQPWSELASSFGSDSNPEQIPRPLSFFCLVRKAAPPAEMRSPMIGASY